MRLRKLKRFIVLPFAFVLLTVGIIGCGKAVDTVESNLDTKTDVEKETEETLQQNSEQQNESEENATHLLGALTPEEALEYMKTTENLVIVEVNTAE
jgi:hypothetical protein